jgi:sugar phosphate isomerase/epimerase
MKGKIGLQLYSLKDILNKNNFVEILEKVKSYGYEGVEGVERDGDPDTVHLFCGKKASEVKSILTDLGLEIVSNHIGLNDLKKNFNTIIQYHKELGCGTLVIAGIPGVYFKNRETVQDTVKELKDFAHKVKDQDLELAFHNCPFNFVSPQSYDLFALEVDEELALQPDAGNAQIVRIEPTRYFKKMRNRFVSMHIKDGKQGSMEVLPLDSGEQGKENETIWKKFDELSTTIGNGAVNLKKFVKLGKARNVEWFIVEEEVTTDPLKTVANAYNYLFKM